MTATKTLGTHLLHGLAISGLALAGCVGTRGPAVQMPPVNVTVDAKSPPARTARVLATHFAALRQAVTAAEQRAVLDRTILDLCDAMLADGSMDARELAVVLPLVERLVALQGQLVAVQQAAALWEEAAAAATDEDRLDLLREYRQRFGTLHEQDALPAGLRQRLAQQATQCVKDVHLLTLGAKEKEADFALKGPAAYDEVEQAVAEVPETCERILDARVWDPAEADALRECRQRWLAQQQRLAGELRECLAAARQELQRLQAVFVNKAAADDYRLARDGYTAEKDRPWYQNQDEDVFVRAMLLCNRVTSDERVDYALREHATGLRGLCWNELWSSDRARYLAAPWLPDYERLRGYPNATPAALAQQAKDAWRQRRAAQSDPGEPPHLSSNR